MSGQRVGYIRVSSSDQNPERQLEGVELDKRFIDQASGKDIKRPALSELVSYVREGDTVVVHSMDRLARNLDDLRRLVSAFTNKKVRVCFVKEGLTFTGEDSPMSNLLLSLMGSFAEFERALLRERQMEGIAIARKKGLYKGRKKVLSQEDVTLLQQQINNGQTKASVARDKGISRETLYKYLKKHLSPVVTQ